MRHNRLVASFLLLVLMSFPIFTVLAQDTTEEPEATEEATAEVTEAPESTAEATETPTDGNTYVVQPGDNLFRIALRYGLTTRQLAEANNITNPQLIYVGQRLVIPDGATTPTATPSPEATEEATAEATEDTTPAPTVTPVPTATPSTGTSNTYVVQPGDTLFRIAVQFNTTVSELLRWNTNITDQNNIFVGQRINVPSDAATPDSDETTDDDSEVSTGLNVELVSGVEVFLGDDSAGEMVAQLGVNAVKITVDWREVEATEGEFQFEALDAIVEQYAAAGVDVVMTLIGSPQWATPSATELALAQNALIPPEDLNDFGTFAGAVAERYAGRVTAYEIWTDPNIRVNWMIPNVELRSDGFPDARLAVEVRYIDLLEMAYNAIKAADANAQVITAGLAPTGTNDFYNAIDDFVFVQALMQQGAANFADAIGVHIDGFSNAPDAECCGTLEDDIGFNESEHFFFGDTLDVYREILNDNGGADVPLAITRVGWGTAENALSAPRADSGYLSENTADEQAQYIADAFAIANERGDVSLMVVYNLNGCTVSNTQACYYSLIDASGSPRPAFAAVQGLDLSADSDAAVEAPEATVESSEPTVVPEATEPAPEATEEG